MDHYAHSMSTSALRAMMYITPPTAPSSPQIVTRPSSYLNSNVANTSYSARPWFGPPGLPGTQISLTLGVYG